MAKESWSARIEAELKKEIQEFIKESEFTNEDLVNIGFNILKNSQIEKAANNDAVQPINKYIFTTEEIDITLFEEIDISKLSRDDLQYKLCSMYFWQPYDILLQMKNGKYLYVVGVNETFGDITFGAIGETIEKVLPLQRIINEIENIGKIFELKLGQEYE